MGSGAIFFAHVPRKERVKGIKPWKKQFQDFFALRGRSFETRYVTLVRSRRLDGE